jgi:hypothetical protein
MVVDHDERDRDILALPRYHLAMVTLRRPRTRTAVRKNWASWILSASVVTAFSVAATSSVAGASGHLQPPPVGSGQCAAAVFVDGSIYAQVGVADASCTQAALVAAGADGAAGKSYHADGFACAAKSEGTGSEWASAWGGTYYAYSCQDGLEQVAFNWGKDYTYATITNPADVTSGHLAPAPLGAGQCQAGALKGGSVYAQIAVVGATCTQVSKVAAKAPKAKGKKYKSDGFSCTSKREGTGSEWASAWKGTYYAYSCKDGSVQAAFTWGHHYIY